MKIQFFLIIVSLKSSAGPVDFSFRNYAKAFSQKLEKWSLKNREKNWKFSNWTFAFLKYFCRTPQCSFDELAQNFLSKIRTFFSSTSEIVWKVILIQNFCFSLTRSPSHVECKFRSPLNEFLPQKLQNYPVEVRY